MRLLMLKCKIQPPEQNNSYQKVDEVITSVSDTKGKRLNMQLATGTKEMKSAAWLYARSGLFTSFPPQRTPHGR
ncbi:hypothetical protein CPZ26_004395 [Raoultella ornithinolytica]|nr:hypothetical protein CU101_00795 [Raoultella ornithinolytica]PJO29150.1 hypothetical protein CPZ26_004395 [Raoultella ornithinolytica]PJR11154.1 hypothetical protein CDD79_06275 [Raoultella ornithinolytica]PQH26637.1 hypothetical protein C5T95_16675 [Raoultella ornithinolytica]RLP21549.1 hypothetical protein D9D10_03160 [Raoultella ornithinolytica]